MSITFFESYIAPVKPLPLFTVILNLKDTFKHSPAPIARSCKPDICNDNYIELVARDR